MLKMNAAMPTKSWATVHTSYTLSPDTFEKRCHTAKEYDAQINGHLWSSSRHWKTERIVNEAKALELLERTNIPVPRLIKYGTSDDGSMYLQTNNVEGIDLCDIGTECHEPDGVRHNSGGGECETCITKAKTNTERFIHSILLPELAKLKSDMTGLDGFVIPPAWMIETDTRELWEVKKSLSKAFIFIHGDLGPSNIRMDPDTLEVVCVIDREHSGYFPREFQKWSVDNHGYFALYEDTRTIHELAMSIRP